MDLGLCVEAISKHQTTNSIGILMLGLGGVVEATRGSDPSSYSFS